MRHGRGDQEAFRSADQGAGLSDIVSFYACLLQSLPSLSTISIGCNSVHHSRLSEHLLILVFLHEFSFHWVSCTMHRPLLKSLHESSYFLPWTFTPTPPRRETTDVSSLHTDLSMKILLYLLHVTWPQWPPLSSLNLKSFFVFFSSLG